MDIFNYSKKVKTFKESDILDQVDTLVVGATDLQENIRLLLANQIDLNGPKHAWFITKSLEKYLSTQGFLDKNGRTLENAVINGCGSLLQVCAALPKTIRDVREKIWDGKLLNLKQANILNLIEQMSFWLRYGGQLFDVLLSMNNDNVSPERYLNKIDIRFINGTEPFFRSLTVEWLKGSRWILTELDKIPELEIDPQNVEVLNETDGKNKVDLLRKGFGIHLLNPIFWFDLAKLKINFMRIENMRRKNERFAMKISQAINKMNGTPDPQLQHQIDVYSDEIIKNEESIASIEAHYA